ncbi:MAG: sulfite exporter TauE/SafE family protein [Mycobacterium sp.]|nr:sulfite exporter TauE/SafE family protein [Mycobacterium sp.]
MVITMYSAAGLAGYLHSVRLDWPLTLAVAGAAVLGGLAGARLHGCTAARLHGCTDEIFGTRTADGVGVLDEVTKYFETIDGSVQASRDCCGRQTSAPPGPGFP